MPVQVSCDAPAGRPYSAGLAADARRLLREGQLKTAELSLLLTGDARIRELNREFRGKDSATDVLSFGQHESLPAPDAAIAGDAPVLLGDIVISVDTASRQARARGISLAERLRVLLIHGFAHLLGYDHERSRGDARIMFRRERELLAFLNQSGRSARPAPPS